MSKPGTVFITLIRNIWIGVILKIFPKFQYDDQNELRFHLHEVVKEAFSDAIHQNLEGIDYYSQGIAESEQKVTTEISFSQMRPLTDCSSRRSDYR